MLCGQSYKQFTLVIYESRVMGYFQVRYDSRVVIYDRGPFLRLTTTDLLRQTSIGSNVFTPKVSYHH